ncbi:MAG: aminotransferase class IV [Tepidisphaeraceae bacterium]
MPSVWINGTFEPEDAAGVSLRDTGLLHGAGVFTTMRSFNGKAFRLAQHLSRLRASCEALFIPLQHKHDELSAAVEEILRRNDLDAPGSTGRLRLTVTRGAAKQDPLHGLHLQPNAFLTASLLEPYPAEYYQKGMTIVLLDDQKLNPYDLTAGHKTLNYLSRLAALRDATRRGAGEAFWFNVHNYLQSGSISNVFVVKDDRLLTPPTPAEMQDATLRDAMPYPKSAVLPGVTRGAVIELAKENGIDVSTTSIDVNGLLEADEVFITNSAMGVMPVCRIERKAIGDDQPGPVTRRLADALAVAVDRETRS